MGYVQAVKLRRLQKQAERSLERSIEKLEAKLERRKRLLWETKHSDWSEGVENDQR